MVQRYKFESKSQRFFTFSFENVGCFQWSKDTNLKANHNQAAEIDGSPIVVFNGPKIQIWKQITTDGLIFCHIVVLFSMVQRYKFESKSQLGNNVALLLFVVFNGPKIQIWKQITTQRPITYIVCVVFNGPKIQIWKQITTNSSCLYVSNGCFQWSKDTNLKANHNNLAQASPQCFVVFNGPKIQIWKQITTPIQWRV